MIQRGNDFRPQLVGWPAAARIGHVDRGTHRLAGTAQHDDPVPQRQRLVHVVRDEDDRGRVGAPGVDEQPLQPDYDAFESRLWPALAHRIPAFEAARLERAWAGYFELNTLDHNAILGPHESLENLLFMNGFSGHGMSLTGLAGKLVAEAIAGTAERFDVFARIPHRDFPGGRLLRRPSLMLAMLYYRLRDLL